MIKCSFPDVRHAVRDRDACKAETESKGFVSDARHTVRDRDARKSVTVTKGIISYACHTRLDDDCIYRLSALVPRRVGEIIHIVRHITRAGDRKSSARIKLPLKFTAACTGSRRSCCQKGRLRRFFHNTSGNQNDLNRLLFGSLFHGEAALGSFVPLRRGKIGICTRREKIAAVLLRKNERIHIALRRVDRKRQLFRRAHKAHAHRHLRRFRRRFVGRLRRGFHGGFRRRRFRRVDLRIAAGHGLRLLRAAVRRPRRDDELNGEDDRKKHGKPFFHILYAPFLCENAFYNHKIILYPSPGKKQEIRQTLYRIFRRVYRFFLFSAV